MKNLFLEKKADIVMWNNILAAFCLAYLETCVQSLKSIVQAVVALELVNKLC